MNSLILIDTERGTSAVLLHDAEPVAITWQP